MKKIFSICFLAIAAVCYSQNANEKAVADAVESLRKAMIDADKSMLERLADDQLTYGHSSGVLEDKKAFVDAIVSGRNDFQKIDQTEQTIRIVGSVALVRHKFKAELLVNGTSATPNIGILQVWQKVKGNWKLIARQAYKL